MGGMKPDWLNQLAPAHAPPAPGWWPLAPGWWAVLFLIIVVVAFMWVRYNGVAMRLRRAAFRELSQLELAQLSDNELARSLESLMRRYAVSRFGRERVAHLVGAEWIAFVVSHQGHAFADEAGVEFLSAAWGKTVTGQRARWIKGARDFIGDKS